MKKRTIQAKHLPKVMPFICLFTATENPEEMAKQINESIEGLKGKIDKAAKDEDVSALKTELETIQKNGATAEQLKGLSDKLDEVAKELLDYKSGGENAFKSVQEQVNEFITKNFDEIKSLKEKGSGFIELKIEKAVGTVTTANGTYPVAAPAITGTQMAPLGDVRLRDIPVFNLVNNFQTDLSAYPYTEAVPGEGDADIVAEGGTKPQIDFDWVTRFTSPYKVAAWIKLTEESVQDVKGLQDVATNYLKKRHDLKKAKLILYGTGSSGQPLGATATGRLFTAGDLANKVRYTNFMDVVNAAIVDIATTHNFADEVPYMANLVMINPVDFFSYLVAAKDERGLPLYPMASIYNQVTIGSVTIIPEETIPAGKIFVADLDKYNVSNYLPYVVKIGWINDDFIKNQFVILGESRFHAYVKNHDKQAFIYDDIETIKTAITYVAE